MPRRSPLARVRLPNGVIVDIYERSALEWVLGSARPRVEEPQALAEPAPPPPQSTSTSSTQLDSARPQPASAERGEARSSPGRKPSPLDDIDDIALIRNVRKPDALVKAAQERNLLVHDFSPEGFPGVIAVLTRSFMEFAKTVAETESPQLSAVESTAVELLKGRRKLESADDKVALALYALNREGALIWDGSRWVEPGRARPAPPLSEQLEQRRAE